MDRAAYLDRARHRGVNPLVYWVVRGIIQPFFHLYFRMSRIGREHVIQDGPMIIAANHRSFLDPFVIGTIIRRPVYFVAKQELFRKPLTAWFLNSLGAFPIDRGNGDDDAMALAKEILERGDVVVIFPEGTRVRPGALGTAKRGVGRLALETGAPVLPVAVIGTERIRKGWRIRPHKVRVRVGPTLRFPRVERPSPDLARAVTDRIWPCVALQWEWLGGLAPVRRAAVVGHGPGARRMADTLRAARVEVTAVDLVADTASGARVGVTAVDLVADTASGARVGVTAVDLVADTASGARVGVTAVDLVADTASGARVGVTAVDLVADTASGARVGVTAVHPADDLELGTQDLVAFAVPARELPAAVDALGARIPHRAGVLVAAAGRGPGGASPAEYVARHTDARAIAVLAAPGDDVVVASADRGFARQLGELLRSAGVEATESTDVAGAELVARPVAESSRPRRPRAKVA